MEVVLEVVYWEVFGQQGIHNLVLVRIQLKEEGLRVVPLALQKRSQ